MDKNIYLEIIKDFDIFKKGQIIEFGFFKAKEVLKSGYAREITKERTEEPEFVEKIQNQEPPKKILKLNTFLDNAKELYKRKPYFYDKNEIWWIWEDDRWKISNDIDMERMLDKELSFCGESISASIRNGNLRAMMWYGREVTPEEAPVKWVQFKNKAFSLESGDIHKVTPDYFFTNPIPFEIGTNEDTPVLDRLFEDWVGKENVKLLYQIIAYCCYRDYPIHRIFCLIGSGRNGKSSFLAILRTFLGLDNLCSTELDVLLENRFESFKLFHKLCCIMGETNFGVMNKTSMLKKLCGQDLIGYEMKNKMPFDGLNYAKLIIASNSLPSSSDTSDGFYRRFTIINFPNEFNEGKDILKLVTQQEYENLALKIKNILIELIKKGEFDNEISIEERKKRYIEASNPLSLYIQEHCKQEIDSFVSYNELYTQYVLYLNSKKRRRVKSKEFKEALENEGFFVEKTTKKINENYVAGYFVIGLRIMTIMTIMTDFPLPYVAKLKEVNNGHNCHNCHNLVVEETILEPKNIAKNDDLYKKNEIYIKNNNLYKFEEIYKVYQKCAVENCLESECNFDFKGIPYCKIHWDLMALK